MTFCIREAGTECEVACYLVVGHYWPCTGVLQGTSEGSLQQRKQQEQEGWRGQCSQLPSFGAADGQVAVGLDQQDMRLLLPNTCQRRATLGGDIPGQRGNTLPWAAFLDSVLTGNL